jgi:hypothetical protein
MTSKQAKAKERDKAREYKTSHLKRLFALSGNQCAEPNCSRTLIAKDGESIIAKICHIKAASSDGPKGTQEREVRRAKWHLLTWHI